jgi:chromosome segregation ATPase
MLPENTWLIGLAILCVVLGAMLSSKFSKGRAEKKRLAEDSSARDRGKKLEESLSKAQAKLKEVQADFDSLKNSSVSKSALESVHAELAELRQALDTAQKRAAALETDLKKSQETLKGLHARANEVDRTQKERSFTLENELSKTRAQLADALARPDNTTELHAEIERLRESVANGTRYAGELRKREAAAQEALQKLQRKLDKQPVESTDPVESAPNDFPARESDRIAAAKAEVIRLHALNAERKNVTPAAELPLFPEEPVKSALAANENQEDETIV